MNWVKIKCWEKQLKIGFYDQTLMNWHETQRWGKSDFRESLNFLVKMIFKRNFIVSHKFHVNGPTNQYDDSKHQLNRHDLKQSFNNIRYWFANIFIQNFCLKKQENGHIFNTDD